MKPKVIPLTNDEVSRMQGEALTAMITTRRTDKAEGDDREYLGDLVTATDLWMIIQTLIPVVTRNVLRAHYDGKEEEPEPLIGVTPDSLKIWMSPLVRKYVERGLRLSAIRATGRISTGSLAEATKAVDYMTEYWKENKSWPSKT